MLSLGQVRTKCQSSSNLIIFHEILFFLTHLSSEITFTGSPLEFPLFYLDNFQNASSYLIISILTESIKTKKKMVAQLKQQEERYTWFVTCVCDYVHGKSVAFSTDCMLQLCTWKSHKFHLSYIAQFIASLFCDWIYWIQQTIPDASNYLFKCIVDVCSRLLSIRQVLAVATNTCTSLSNTIHIWKWLSSGFRCSLRCCFWSSKHIPEPQCFICCCWCYCATIWTLKEVDITLIRKSLIIRQSNQSGLCSRKNYLGHEKNSWSMAIELSHLHHWGVFPKC